MTKIRFSSRTTKHLGHYVYALVDPRDRSIFYVGKASGNNRAYDHLSSELGETAKHQRINEIRLTSPEPVEVEILRYGLKSEEACFEVEAAIIDTIGLENLTNKVRGHGVKRGRKPAKELERLYGSEPVDIASIKDRLLLFFINRTYSPTMSEIEIYDCVRQFWAGVGASRRTPDESGALPYPTALGIADGTIVRAYSIAAWFPAGTTLSTRRQGQGDGRWEFVGQLLPDHPLVGRRLVDRDSAVVATQQGYRYIN